MLSGGYQEPPFFLHICWQFYFFTLKLRCMAGKNLFNSIRVRTPEYNSFKLSHEHKFSCNAGFLIPTMVRECLPGDKIKIGCESLIRASPLVNPTMHRVDVKTEYFFVPTRILWDNWNNFMTKTPVGGVVPAHPFLTITEGNWNVMDDHMGIPPPIAEAGPEIVSALPYAAVQSCYHEWYRQQQIIPEFTYKCVDGNNNANTELRVLRKRAWEHDRFTSALPTAQAGQPVDIPLGDVRLKSDWGVGADTRTPTFRDDIAGDVGSGAVSIDATSEAIEVASQLDGVKNAYDPDGTLETSPVTINDLRTATRLQEWFEMMARVGKRIIEWTKGAFGVDVGDARAQRPEFIVGTSSPVMIGTVLNTTGTEEAPQGNMAGQGTAVVNGRYGYYFAREHGFVVALFSIMPRTGYQQGIDKMFLRLTDSSEYYWPHFAHLGEEPIKLRELYAWTDGGDDTFGYTPRYGEYRYAADRVSGQFRTTLDTWHWTRKFATVPELNEDFIECNPGKRIFAVTDPEVDGWYCQVWHDLQMGRKIPVFGTPTL